MFTLEDELDELDIELGAARRRLHSLERAPFDGRWARLDAAWDDAWKNQRHRISVLEKERAGILADLVAQAERFVL